MRSSKLEKICPAKRNCEENTGVGGGGKVGGGLSRYVTMYLLEREKRDGKYIEKEKSESVK